MGQKMTLAKGPTSGLPTWLMADLEAVFFIRAILTVILTIAERFPGNASFSILAGDRGPGTENRRKGRGSGHWFFNPRI